MLGMLIPPSVMLILYAIITEQSVGHMFIAGIIPAFCSRSHSSGNPSNGHFFPKAGNEGVHRPNRTGEAAIFNGSSATTNGVPILLLVGIVLGGIYTGWFTATEAGAAGAVGALIVAVFKND